MASLTLRGITKRYEGSIEVIRGIDLDIADGEFAVFVGPSGCGKSTTLRMIAGLEDLTDGEIHIGDRLINDVPPAQRGVAMVFQSYALYPHMTVGENMGFALKLAGQSKAEIAAAVGRAAEILRSPQPARPQAQGPLGWAAAARGDRPGHRAQAGRVPVRRAAVEPRRLAAHADAHRARRSCTRNCGSTMIYVTHDQVEATTLGDRIAVFNAGRIEQVGTPLDLYARPANKFVAGFLGSPRMNFIQVTGHERAGGGTRLRVDPAGAIDVPGAFAMAPSGPLMLGIRPEHLGVTRVEEGLAARIDLLEHLGDSMLVHATLRGTDNTVSIRVPASHTGLRAGVDIGLAPQSSQVLLFGAAGEALALH